MSIFLSLLSLHLNTHCLITDYLLLCVLITDYLLLCVLITVVGGRRSLDLGHTVDDGFNSDPRFSGTRHFRSAAGW